MPASAQDITELYRRHAQTLLLYFQRRVHDPELAADLLGATFESAIRGAPRYRGSTDGELTGWLWTIARNELGDQARRESRDAARWRRLGRSRIALSDREIERIEELAGMERLRDVVARLLARLPDEQREAVRLRVLEGLSYADIARRMNISADNARARVSRGLRAIATGARSEHEAWRRDEPV